MLIEYSAEMISDDPDFFDAYVVSSLKSIFHDNLKNIIDRLYSEVNCDTILTFETRIERQIFPALIISYEFQGKNNLVEDFCCNFIKGYTLPLLYLDQWLDSNNKINKNKLSEVFKLIYSSQHFMTKLDNWSNVFKRLSYNHLLETQQTFFEFINRFTIPGNLEKFMNTPNCYLFPSIAGGILDFYNIHISDQLEQMFNLFSYLRQISDAISDIEEDLNSGIITLPIIYTLQAYDITSYIKNYWNKEIPFATIERYIIKSNAYSKCFDKFMSIYKECQMLKNKITDDYNFIENLFILYDLKLCLLYRLKNNLWRDNRKIY